jgi:hypothetical protein
LHAALQVAFGWSDGHLYTFHIRGWQFGDPARAIELALAGGGVDIPLAAFGFEIGKPFLYRYKLSIPWEIGARIEARGLIPAAQPVTCEAAKGDPPDEDLAGPAAYSQCRMDSDPAWVLHQIEELLEEKCDEAHFRAEACEILTQARSRPLTRRAIAERLLQLPDYTEEKTRAALAAATTQRAGYDEVAEPRYNLIERARYESELENVCVEEGLGVIESSGQSRRSNRSHQHRSRPGLLCANGQPADQKRLACR